MLKKAHIVMLAVAMLLMTCMISVGYASLTDTLKIQGTANIEVPSGLFITDIREQGVSNVDHQSSSFYSYSTTVEVVIDKKYNTTTQSGGWRPTTTTTKYEGR